MRNRGTTEGAECDATSNMKKKAKEFSKKHCNTMSC
jgi:hypothetical protein